MSWCFWGASLACAFVAAAYLQIPTFLLGLGYGWFHRYGPKRWILRVLSLVFLGLFLFRPEGVAIWTILASIPVFALLGFSMINANPRVFVALGEADLVCDGGADLPADQDEAIVLQRADGGTLGYPLEEMVVPRHLVHDRIDGEPILISYCMACRSAIVYRREIRGLVLEFDVLGVYRRNMVMVDRQTGTVWQQGTGEAVKGALEGERLDMLPYQIVSWGAWRRTESDAQLVREAPGTPEGLFSKERLRRMLRITEVFMAPGRTKLDALPLRTKVLGLVVGTHAKAYPESLLEEITELHDHMGGHEILLSRNPVSRVVRAHLLSSGREIPVQRHWWFGWKEFHPDTAIWEVPGS